MGTWLRAWVGSGWVGVGRGVARGESGREWAGCRGGGWAGRRRGGAGVQWMGRAVGWGDCLGRGSK